MTLDVNIKETTSSAGSKLILFGEHGVVHGTDAIVIGLKEGITAVAKTCNTPSNLFIKEWNLKVSYSGTELIDIACTRVLDFLTIKQNVKIIASSVMPHGAGLGSSASLAAAVTLSLNNLFDLSLGANDIQKAINESEKIFHTTPSGVDAFAVLNEGIFKYNKLSGICSLGKMNIKFIVINTGQLGSTVKSIEIFADKLKNANINLKTDNAKINLDKISSIVKKAIIAIKNGNNEIVGALMNENHNLLKWFGVSSDSLNEICLIALKFGALGAKMTGGGLGGSAIVLPSKNMNIDGFLTTISNLGYKRII